MTSQILLPLQGKTVIITRAQNKQAEARILFEKFGANVLDLPALVIGPPNNWEQLDNALLELKEFNWIIFSSSNGVDAVCQRLKIIGQSLREKPKDLKIAAVGKKTALTLSNIGIEPDFIPPKFVAESLIDNFPVSEDNLKILLPRVESGGRSFLANALNKKNFEVIEVPAYESHCPSTIPSRTLDAINRNEFHAIAFTSGKTVLHTVNLLEKYFDNKWYRKLEGVKIISIGPQTTKSCKEYFHKVDKEASPYDLEGLVLACMKSFE